VVYRLGISMIGGPKALRSVQGLGLRNTVRTVQKGSDGFHCRSFKLANREGEPAKNTDRRRAWTVV
jgi:hypothetical protein